MSHLINVSDDIYEKLTKVKKIRKKSYSEVIASLMYSHYGEKKEDKEDLCNYLKEMEEKYRGKPRENISENIDGIVYGE